MTGKKQQSKPAKSKKGGFDNAKVQMQDFHLPSIKSPRDSASGEATG
jgi:hypothetical protein